MRTELPKRLHIPQLRYRIIGKKTAEAKLRLPKESVEFFEEVPLYRGLTTKKSLKAHELRSRRSKQSAKKQTSKTKSAKSSRSSKGKK